MFTGVSRLCKVPVSAGDRLMVHKKQTNNQMTIFHQEMQEFGK